MPNRSVQECYCTLLLSSADLVNKWFCSGVVGTWSPCVLSSLLSQKAASAISQHLFPLELRGMWEKWASPSYRQAAMFCSVCLAWAGLSTIFVVHRFFCMLKLLQPMREGGTILLLACSCLKGSIFLIKAMGPVRHDTRVCQMFVYLYI